MPGPGFTTATRGFCGPANCITSSRSSTPVTLTRDAGATTVTISGHLAGCDAQLVLISPYGTFGAGNVVLAGSPAVATLSPSNPDGYTCRLAQAKMDSDYLGSGKMMTRMSIAGTNYHRLFLYDVLASRSMGAVIATAPFVSLPSWLHSRLAGRSA